MKSSSDTTSNGLLSTIEMAGHSDDESAPPSLNPTAAAAAASMEVDADDLPNYENVSTSPMMSPSTKIPTPSRFADNSRFVKHHFANTVFRDYRVTIHVVPNLLFTSKQKFCFSVRPMY